jgi:hypothetical protein
MPKQKNGHVLKFEDGTYFIEQEPFTTVHLDEAEIYYKYFDLMEAQARALRNTEHEARMVKVTFSITDISEQ